MRGGNKGIASIALIMAPIFLTSLLIYSFYLERTTARNAYVESKVETKKLGESIANLNIGDTDIGQILDNIVNKEIPKELRRDEFEKNKKNERAERNKEEGKLTSAPTPSPAIPDKGGSDESSTPSRDGEESKAHEEDGRKQGGEEELKASVTEAGKETAPPAEKQELSEEGTNDNVEQRPAVGFSHAILQPADLNFPPIQKVDCSAKSKSIARSLQNRRAAFTITSSKLLSDTVIDITKAVAPVMQEKSKGGWVTLSEPRNFVLGVELQLAVDTQTREESYDKRLLILNENIKEFTMQNPTENYFEVSHMAIKAYADVILQEFCPCVDTTLIFFDEDLLKSAAERLEKQQRACDHKYLYCTRLLTDATKRHPFDRDDEMQAERDDVDAIHGGGDGEMAEEVVDLSELTPGSTIVGPAVDMIAHLVDVFRRMEELQVKAEKAGCRVVRLNPSALETKEGAEEFLRALYLAPNGSEDLFTAKAKSAVKLVQRASERSVELYAAEKVSDSVQTVANHYLQSCIAKGVPLPLSVIPPEQRTSMLQSQP
mmetsp:Transcript_22640/g.57707  ORF Transcript_22640/g.57707 Transcript_22640/m.57707 type:complete len:545 (-) Transcript_22640:302-1936(-)